MNPTPQPDPAPMPIADVVIDGDIRDLIPQFLANRRAELDTLRQALTQDERQVMARLSHNIKGVSGSFGFAGLSDLAARLERAALADDLPAMTVLLERMDEYLSGLVIRYR